MKSAIAGRIRWALVVVGSAAASFGVLAYAESEAEGPRGSQDACDVDTEEVDQLCQWQPSYAIGPRDFKTEGEGRGATSTHVEVLAKGMEIWGYGHAYTSEANKAGNECIGTAAVSSFGSVTVKRIRFAPGHVPYMRIDWYPHFRAEARVRNPDADCYAAGVMKGDAYAFPVHVLAKGGASADGEEHNTGLTITVGAFEVSLSRMEESANAVAPMDCAVDTRQIDQATAAFCCSSAVQAHAPCSGFFDMREECEAWLWDSYPGLDLHGYCGSCDAFAYGCYGWQM